MSVCSKQKEFILVSGVKLSRKHGTQVCYYHDAGYTRETQNKA